MLFGFPFGDGLELRRSGDGGAMLSGSFPYRERAVLSDGGRNGGRPRKEVVEPRAFAYRVERPDEDIHLLVGHDYGQPLASKLSGSLKLADDERALTFTAAIAPEMMQVTWVRDILATIAAGLAIGISPGFRLPPPRTGVRAERIEQEDDEGPGSENRGAVIRHIFDALLYELSIVTSAAYPKTQVELRSWQPDAPAIIRPPTYGALRWR